VDVAMTDSILAMSELLVSQYAYRGVSQKPVGNRLPGLAPQGTVRAKDGMIAIAAPHDPQWLQLCRLMDREDLAKDPRFGSETLRWENNTALTGEIETFTMRYTKLELREIFGGKVPFSPIYTAEEIFSDPHFAARNMLPKVDHPGVVGQVAVPGVPAKLSTTPGAVRQRAPKLGEHTREILREAGLSDASIARLLAEGAVAVSV
jgi:crotonobetainyl-CoA:carnitine CoA-transferase CaiB-like acyl-CoA transferase